MKNLNNKEVIVYHSKYSISYADFFCDLGSLLFKSFAKTKFIFLKNRVNIWIFFRFIFRLIIFFFFLILSIELILLAVLLRKKLIITSGTGLVFHERGNDKR